MVWLIACGSLVASFTRFFFVVEVSKSYILLRCCRYFKSNVATQFFMCFLVQLQNMAFLDEISSVHEQKIMCASVHLISGVHLQYPLDLWLIYYGQFIYFLLILTMKDSAPNGMHVSRAILLHYCLYVS